MWRHVPTFVKVQAVILAVPTVVMACSLGIASIQAAHKQEAARVSRLASIHADQIIADERAGAELERTRQSLTTVTVERDQAQARVTDLEDQVGSLEGQVESLKAQTAYRATTTGYGGGGSPQPVVAAGNHFPYGQCTWHVANRRSVPWFGNAGTWLSGARAYGYATGSTPRPGAIMVTAESPVGHVAYVESVGANSFTVSEMNYRGWGVVDWRTVAMGSWFIRGFVY